MASSPSLLTSRIELSRLPVEWLEPPLRDRLSGDGQFYYLCGQCNAESRVPMLLVGEKGYLKEACANCNAKGKWQPITHAVKVTIKCLDCQRQSGVLDHRDEVWRCERCQSSRVEMLSVTIHPPFPAKCYEFDSPSTKLDNLGKKKKIRHVWGLSAQDDANYIRRDSQFLSTMPERHRYLYSLILFADRMLLCHERAEAEGRYLILNILGNLSQDYLRTTGSWAVGLVATK
jgi:DNA-directed RNA polymerase subunit RPC12/RpoP